MYIKNNFLIISLYILLLVTGLKQININTPKIKTTRIIIDKTIKTIIPYKEEINEKPIGKIIIPKIDLEQYLFKKESSQNNIDKNVTILESSEYPNIDKSTLIIAAHSGIGKIAFFNRLNEIQLNDTIIIEYNNTEYKYMVKNIYEKEKDGNIYYHPENKNQLLLTTCCPNKDNCQLIIQCIKIEF